MLGLKNMTKYLTQYEINRIVLFLRLRLYPSLSGFPP